MGIVVHPLARSDSASDNIKSVVRSSRSCGCLTITAITREFSAKFSTVIATMMAGLKSSKSNILMLVQYCALATQDARALPPRQMPDYDIVSAVINRQSDPDQ